MAAKQVILSLLMMFSTGAWAHSDFSSRANEAGHLLKTLYDGVEQCFNPNQVEAIQKTQGQIQHLGAEVHQALQDWAAGNQARIAIDAKVLSNELNAFNDSPGFPASLYCGTKRKCLEIGFEGNARYPRCLPVNGDIHQNVQYRSFEQLMNKTLPEVVALLRKASAI